jgi:hypothetical protein
MERNGIKRILSFDSGFDTVPGLYPYFRIIYTAFSCVFSLEIVACRTPALAGAELGPVFYRQVFEPCEVPSIDRDKDETIGMSDRGNLTIDVRRRPAETFQACSLPAVPGRGRFVVRQNGEGWLHDIRQIGFKSGSSFTPGEPVATIRQLVPNRGPDSAFVSTLLELLDDLQAWFPGDRRRHNTGIQEIPKGHKETLRPAPFSRAAWKKSFSIPTSLSECFRRNAL